VKISNSEILTQITEPCFDENTEYLEDDLTIQITNMDYSEGAVMTDSVEKCQQYCKERKKCTAFIWKSNKSCWLKISTVERNVLNGAISDRKYYEKGVILILLC
jgi:hypothetical protein